MCPKASNWWTQVSLKVVKTIVHRVATKMMMYPQYYGGPNEDVVCFFENLELAWISNHIQDDMQL